MLDTQAHPMREDLMKSGLDPADIKARAIDSVERAATGIPHSIQGYAIPYWDLRGHPLPFYRVRAFNHIIKYKQGKDTPNHVYFPPNFYAVAQKKDYILVTEGEKKAALATKLGFPCVGLSGVDCWRNRVVVIPLESELSQNQSKGILKAKLPPQTEASEDNATNLATGMQELIDYAASNHKTIIICYDSDQEVGVKPSVQRAAAVLGFELRFRGISFDKIRQIILPPINAGIRVSNSNTPEEAAQLNKVALDDYLVEKGKDAFQGLLETCLAKRSAFPRHPSIRDYINKKLQKAAMSRKDVQALAIAVLSDLDANGMRIRSSGDQETYYFDFVSRKLLKTTFSERAENVAATPFGQFMYRRYGLGGADQRLIIWIATQFAAEDPIEEASPFHVIARTRTVDDCVNYQVSDSQFVRVNADGIELFDNGEGNILFESGGVLPLDTEKLSTAYEKCNSEHAVPNYWASVLSHVRLKDQDKGRQVTSLLYYMSPWLYRWRGMQLPVELVIGESGSGKSTLCELRLNVLSGTAKLRNAPTDLKDWHASISNSGGLHVTDNVQLVDRNLRQRLSDEICRIITEPEPTIEQRKLYTNTDLVRIPIRAVFGITAIQQPFQNADILQRALILELDKTANTGEDRPEVTYDSEWKQHQLDAFGGREGWIAHHLVVLERFFKLVKTEWDPKYKAKHRLIHFEQSMLLMGRVFGMDTSWIPAYLAGIVDATLAETDWTFEGIREFVDKNGSYLLAKQEPFTVQDISEWCKNEDEYKECDMLINPRRLGRYMQIHKSIIAQHCCIVEAGKLNNRVRYKVVAPKKK
jgi:hypothetical protein